MKIMVGLALVFFPFFILFRMPIEYQILIFVALLLGQSGDRR